MPFVVYFFLSLLIIYIPFPTALLFFQQLAEQHDTITALNKLSLLFFCPTRLLHQLSPTKKMPSKSE